MTTDLTPPERAAFSHLWALADPEQTGVLIGDQAVKFFAPSRLPPSVLGQVWALSDKENVGFLTADGFSTALRLIGHAQQGEPVSPALASRPAPPPVFEGITYPGAPDRARSAAPPPPPPRSIPHPAPAPPVPAPSGVVITQADKARYARIFANAGPVGGVLDADKAKSIFLKSQLPFDKLGAIWGLADSRDRGVLDLVDFTLAMHFIQGTMNGTISFLPSALPPGLYEQASGGAPMPPRTFTPAQPSRSFTPASPGVPSRPPTGFGGAPIPPQYTGSVSGAPMRAASVGPAPVPAQYTGSYPPRPSTGFAPLQAQTTGSQYGGGAGFAPVQAQPTGSQFGGAAAHGWDISPAERASANQFFDSMDSDKTGQLEGSLVVPFFLQSKLDETTLAHVWDLSDITQSGALSRDEFSVAMHLINKRLAGQEVPQTLPLSLIPPSLRGQVGQAGQAAAPPPLPAEPIRDLMSLMDDDPPPPVSTEEAFGAPAFAPPAPASVAGSAAAAPAPVSREATGAFNAEDPFGQPVGTTAAAPAPWGASAVQSPLSPASDTHTPSGASPPQAVAQANSGLGAGAERGAPNGADSVFLQAAERELEKVKGQRVELETTMASNTKSMEEMRERIRTVQTDIEKEQTSIDELQAKARAEAQTLSEVKAQAETQQARLAELEKEKTQLQDQMAQDKAEVKSANHRMAQAQTKTGPIREEVESLRAAQAPKQAPIEPEPAPAPAPAAGTEAARDLATTAPRTAAPAPDTSSQLSLLTGPPLTHTTSQRSTNPFGPPSPVVPSAAPAPPAPVPSLPPATAPSNGFDDAFGALPAGDAAVGDEDPTFRIPGGGPSFDDAFGDSFASLNLQGQAAVPASAPARPAAPLEPLADAARKSVDTLHQEYIMPEHPSAPASASGAASHLSADDQDPWAVPAAHTAASAPAAEVSASATAPAHAPVPATTDDDWTWTSRE